MLRIDKLKAGRLPPLSFEVADGECLSIEGPSGAGKSLLLRAIADLDPASGHVFLDGGERREISAAAWRRQVRYCSAEPVWWTQTPRGSFPDGVFEGTGSTGRGSRLDRVMRSLDVNPALLDQPVATLSTGERQRLALVRGLSDEPKAILFDEPTGSLDSVSAGLVEELIKFLLLSGRNIVLVSHDPRQIERLAHTRLQLAQAVVARVEGRAA
ncbi:MAG: ATP-binding cassette domain-containing protein [Hyphomicrobiaceae bacterium]